MRNIEQYTPMIKQYLEVKNKLSDAIVFYRLGDFYEMFFVDAQIASAQLDLVLTARNGGVEKVPMCGIPHHAASGYIQRLVQKGYKVAIVEQMENPADAKGIVKRDVIKIVTPGTIMDEINDAKATVTIAGMYDFQYGLAVVLCEMTTGEMRAQIIDKQAASIQKVLLGNGVKEVVLPKHFDKKVEKRIADLQMITISHMENEELNPAYQHLLAALNDERITKAFITLTNYLEDTQKRNVSHLMSVELVKEDDYVQMDFATKANLELTQTLRSNSRSQTLWSFLDHCQSAMGSRLLRKWIEYPLLDVQEINRRLDGITFLNENFITKDELREQMKQVYDLERLCARVAYGSANPRNLLQIIKTLKAAPQIIALFVGCDAYQAFQQVDACEELLKLLDGAIVEDAPISIKDGGIFVTGYDTELDEVRKIAVSGKDWILELEAKERERTGIKSLKIGYNRIYGYYIEVTKANLDQVKESFGYVRKQTLTNCERFVTEELKEREDAIVHAQEKSVRLEQRLFLELLERTRAYLPKLHQLAAALATMDVLYALAVISSENGYVRPIFHEGSAIDLEEARHPILEKAMKQKRYVSNDLKMEEDCNVLMITGPNMGGKSTYMRQMACIAIMAQIGCFVPAQKAHLPLFDKIFTRIGASDDIMSGESTFMVEMIEANHALQNATPHSLILFDEIGRGTSTYDGMALAQAMIEYICHQIHAKTLFSTHYHELTALAQQETGIRNVHVEVHEEDEHVTFLYRVNEGKADKSYGINVARLAKLPEGVIERAKRLLESYEIQEHSATINAPIYIEKPSLQEKQLHDRLEAVDVNQMTPMQAMQFIVELQELLKKGGEA